jgi:predicted nucleotidyltransferase/HEPN domain-containing protein
MQMANRTLNYQQALQTARQFVRAVQKLGIRLDGAYLYGSYALGTAHEQSDIDIALVSNDFRHRSADWTKLYAVIKTIDARIEFVQYRPKDFRDENPLVWEIKTMGVWLLDKPRPAYRADSQRSLRVRSVVNYWKRVAEHHWQMARTSFKLRRYLYALSFGRWYVEAMLKATIVRRTRAHAPFRLTLPQFAEQAQLALTLAQRDLLARWDTYTLEADAPDHPLSSRKLTRRLCQAEMRAMRRFAQRL